MSRAYRKWSYWEELAPKLASDVEAGIALTTLAFHHDVSARRMAEILDHLGIDRPEHYSRAHEEPEHLTHDLYSEGDPSDIEYECTARPVGHADHNGNSRIFHPGRIRD